jgi:hypothetical protein
MPSALNLVMQLCMYWQAFLQEAVAALLQTITSK